MNYKKVKTMRKQRQKRIVLSKNKQRQTRIVLSKKKQRQTRVVLNKKKRLASGKKDIIFPDTTIIKSNKTIAPSISGECLFEAFLSVFIEILGEEDVYKMIIYPINCTGVPKAKLLKPWSFVNGFEDVLKDDFKEGFIFYQASKKSKKSGPEETHYQFATKESIIIDPYHMFQLPFSHGFCQMFAFFIAAYNKLEVFDDIEKELIKEAYESFLPVDEIKTGTKEKSVELKQLIMSKYRHNTYICLKYTLKLIAHKATKDYQLLPKMEEVFDTLKAEDDNLEEEYKHGIGENMTFSDFLVQLEFFLNHIESLDQYIREILWILVAEKKVNFTDEEMLTIPFNDLRPST